MSYLRHRRPMNSINNKLTDPWKKLKEHLAELRKGTRCGGYHG